MAPTPLTPATTPAPVVLTNGHPILFNLSYNGSILTVTITDEWTLQSNTIAYTMNLASLGATATMGFTGGTGGANAVQTFSNFTFSETTSTASNEGLTNNIIPYATAANGAELASYTATHGIQAYSAAGFTYSTSIAAAVVAGATTNVRLTANDTLTQSMTVNSLTFSGSQTLTIPAGMTLTVGSGGLLVTGGSVTIKGGGTLLLGSSTMDGIISVNSGATLSLGDGSGTSTDAVLSANNLTLGGSGTVNFSGNNFLTGTTTLAGATLVLGGNAGLGANIFNSQGLVNQPSFALYSGTLQGASGGASIPNPVLLNNSNVTLGGSNPIVFTGAVTLNGVNNVLNVTNTAVTNFGGVISGR